jgi:hypothetical protein
MNDLLVVIGVILFPGIVATIITDKIIVHMKSWGSLEYALYSFILGVFAYFFLQCFSWLQGMLPQSWQFISSLKGPLDVWNIIADSKSRIDLSEVVGATLLAIPLAFGTAFLVNHKIFYRIASRLGVSSKYGDENLFSFYLNAQEIDWIYARDIERKLTYQGRVYSFSETENDQELVLTDVTVFGYEDSDEYYSVPTLYLCRTRGSLVIEAIPQALLERTDGEETA